MIDAERKPVMSAPAIAPFLGDPWVAFVPDEVMAWDLRRVAHLYGRGDSRRRGTSSSAT